MPAPTTATRVTDGVPPCSPVASTPRQGFQVLLEDRGVVEVLVLGAVDQRQTLPPGNVDKPPECRLMGSEFCEVPLPELIPFRVVLVKPSPQLVGRLNTMSMVLGFLLLRSRGGGMSPGNRRLRPPFALRSAYPLRGPAARASMRPVWRSRADPRHGAPRFRPSPSVSTPHWTLFRTVLRDLAVMKDLELISVTPDNRIRANVDVMNRFTE